MQTNQFKPKISDVAVVIPSFNEAKKIQQVINELKLHFNFIVVVDDGSSDDTESILRDSEIIYLKHPINLGQGAALQTGISFAVDVPDIEYILNFDADGQHSISSALNFVEVIKETNVDIVMGSRFIDLNHDSGMPRKKKIILRLGIIFTRLNTGLKVTDTHNGLRIMTKKFAKTLNIRQSGMAHASEIISHVKISKATWLEAPADIYYTEYSIQKGQSVLNAINIVTELIHRW
jgi:glycosyltransferase involved in cell wall biosynthesis